MPALARRGHALVDQPDQLLQGLLGLGHGLRQGMLGLRQKPKELLLFPCEEDVVGQRGDQLLPDSHVPLGKGLQFGKN